MARDDDQAVLASADWLSVTKAFAAHARRMPNALAIEAAGERRNYAELATRVDEFAARLADRLGSAVGTGNPLIGVCLERDVDLPAWLFAIMTIGGAYLPIDPSTPHARLLQMMEDAAPVLIVSSRHHAGVVVGGGVPVLIAEDEPDTAPSLFAFAPIRQDDLAYVIFTSGSTGRPKGVEIEHRSLAALMATMAACPGLRPGERMLGLTRISFDLSVPDLFLPFYVGGALILVGAEATADPDQLAASFATYRPDLAQATPSTWRALLESGWEGHPTLRVVAGGEAVTRALADRLLPRCGELWNIYGPTETTVWSTAARVEPGTGPVPIGRPMTGYRVHVADEGGRPLPPGEVGEIVIGGIGVARGYRNRADLTAERFISRPDGSRAYRTGDLGRLDDTGALFCLGRLDDQVKLRGFRIELGDIEATLALHPSVAWTAARVWSNPDGEPTLVAYLVNRSGYATSVRELRQFLGTRIPPYMIPDRFHAITVMPLTPNGKVDRAALPNPFDTQAVKPGRLATGTAPLLAEIWSDLLGVQVASGDDDFFDLGGYSLMTVRLARRIETSFGTKLALIDLMRFSTLTAMATRIDQGDTANDIANMMLLNTGGTRPPLHWLDAGPLMRTMARSLSADQPAYALNLDPEEEDALAQYDSPPIDRIAAVLKSRLLERQPEGPYYLGGWCRWGIVAFELARQLIEDGREVALLVMIDAEHPSSETRSGRLRRRIMRLLGKPRGTVPDDAASFSQRVEAASRAYRPQRYGGAVLLLRPAHGVGDAGWGKTVDGCLSVRFTSGDHISMVRKPAVDDLAQTLDHALYHAQQASCGSGRSSVQATVART